MTPSAVLVIKDGVTKLVNIKNQDSMTRSLIWCRISSINLPQVPMQIPQRKQKQRNKKERQRLKPAEAGSAGSCFLFAKA